jgi:hypothetical protein
MKAMEAAINVLLIPVMDYVNGSTSQMRLKVTHTVC